jgi:hypothetical protein
MTVGFVADAGTAAAAAKVTRWKVVETSAVTDESLTDIVNDWTSRGWTFEGMQFAMRESSKRPAMAFVVFTRVSQESDGDGPG